MVVKISQIKVDGTRRRHHFSLPHIVWKSHKKSHLNFGISTNFCRIKIDLSGNTVWPQASDLQKLAKMDNFGHFLFTFVYSKCIQKCYKMRLFEDFYLLCFTWFFYQFNGLVNWSYLIYDFLSDHCNSLFWAKSTKPKVPRVCHHRAVAKNKDVVPAKKSPLQPLPVEIMSWNQVLKTLLWILTQPKIYPHKSFWKTKGKKVWNISNYKREQRLKSLKILEFWKSKNFENLRISFKKFKIYMFCERIKVSKSKMSK